VGSGVHRFSCILGGKNSLDSDYYTDFVKLVIKY